MRWERFHGYLDKDCGGLEQGREKLRSERGHISKKERALRTWGRGWT